MSTDQTAKAQQSPATPKTPHTPQTPATLESLKIESVNINTEPGIQLSEQQRILIGSVLDLFKGKPSLPKLRLWKQTATFKDPLTVAEGYKKFAAQWYGLKTAFSEIEQLSHEVKDAGDPIKMDLKTRYKVKGTNTEKIIPSKIEIHVKDNMIDRVEDQWDGSIEEGAVKSALRLLNASSVPLMVKVPETDEEDAKMGNQ